MLKYVIVTRYLASKQHRQTSRKNTRTLLYSHVISTACVTTELVTVILFLLFIYFFDCVQVRLKCVYDSLPWSLNK